MRIGEAAAAAGTTPRALRLYEARGLLPPPPRSASGQREYGPAEVTRVRVIRGLLDLGLTLEDVRRRAHRLDLIVRDGPPAACAGGLGGFSDVVAGRLAALDAEIARLTRLRRRLAAATVPTAPPPATPAPAATVPAPTAPAAPAPASCAPGSA